MTKNNLSEKQKAENYLRDKYGPLLTPEDVQSETGLAITTLAKWRSQKINLSYTNLGTGRGSPPRYPVSSVAEFMFRNMVKVNH